MKNDKFSFDKNTWSEYSFFNEKNREQLKNTFMYFNCRDLNSFGNTNFIDIFNGTFNGKFSLNYTINQKNCDEINEKADIFYRKMKNLEASKSNDGIQIQTIGFFAFEEKYNKYSKSMDFVKLHINESTKNDQSINNNQQTNETKNKLRKIEIEKKINQLKIIINSYENDIKKTKLKIEELNKLKNKNNLTKEQKNSIEKDIYVLFKNIEQINIKKEELYKKIYTLEAELKQF